MGGVEKNGVGIARQAVVMQGQPGRLGGSRGHGRILCDAAGSHPAAGLHSRHGAMGVDV